MAGAGLKTSRALPALALLALALFAGPGARAQTKATATALPQPVRDALAAQRLPAGELSVYVHRLGAAEPLLAHNADLARQPASTIKLLTTFAALELLGPAYRWRTEAYLRGRLRNGVLDGALLLKGYGDPYLTSERLWLLLRALRRRGLDTIGGGLLIDNGYFLPAATTTGAFDGAGGRAYNALPTALMVNFQALGVSIVPQIGGGGRVSVDPNPANLSIVDRLRYVGGRCRGRRVTLNLTPRRGGARLTVGGRYPLSCGEQTLYRLLLSPRQQTAGLVQTLWRELGGEIGDSVAAATAGASDTLLHTERSPPLAELLRGINKFSNNVMTRQLLLTIGATRFGAPGSEDKGRRAVAAWLAANGLAFPELTLDNGSGLSRRTRISARSLGRLLLAADASRYGPELLASLPLAALDGTLKRRFRDEPLAGKVRLKTGSLSNVRAVAGYVTDARGRRYALVSLHNRDGLGAAAGERVQDALLRWLYAR